MHFYLRGFISINLDLSEAVQPACSTERECQTGDDFGLVSDGPTGVAACDEGFFACHDTMYLKT